MSLTFKKRLITYSQNREDLTLWGYFHKLKTAGRYIDIGANDPIEDSVTKFFYLRGWVGINIEPQTTCFSKIQSDRPKDINLQVGISDKDSIAEITTFKNSGISTFNSIVASGYSTNDVVSKDAIRMLTLETVMRKYVKNKQVHFLKIDVEGFEDKVIAGANWQKYRPWVICIEHTWLPQKWEKTLLNNDYIPHIFDGLNGYFVAKEHEDLIDDYVVYSNSESIRHNDANTIKRVLPFSIVANKIAKTNGYLQTRF